MHATRRSRHTHSYSASGSIGQKAQLVNAYQELGKELHSTQLKVVGNYTLGRTIGEGSFGNVRLGVHRLTGTRVAIKHIPKSSCPPLLTREIHHHRRLHHPSVVQLYEVIATESSIWLVTELCAGGELFDYLVEKGRLTEAETRRIFGQVCLGMGYVHRQGVVHRDLKLENVLLDERCNAKVADFGFGREFEQRRLLETFCGTTGYAAPEMLAGRKYLAEEVDIWSLGIIFYTLLAGSLPFDDDDEDIMKGKIVSGVYVMPDFISREAQDLIGKILQIDPKDRLPIEQILGHPWFTTPPGLHEFGETAPAESTRPWTIMEEPETLSSSSSVRLAPTSEPVGLGILSESEASEHSMTGDESDLGIGSSRSGASSPVTSEDTPPNGTVATTSGGAGSKQSGPSGERSLGLQHPNASQSTIRKAEASGSSKSNATPKGKARQPSLSTHDEGGGSAESNLLGREPRSHQRAASNVTINASAIARRSTPAQGSPVYPASPSIGSSRTPSRTKRRSIGSTMSERMLPSDDFLGAPYDYVSALKAIPPTPLSTTQDGSLLAALTTLGFDAGQIVHSVRTNACDASGAIWWLLKRKVEQREADREFAERLAAKSREAMEREYGEGATKKSSAPPVSGSAAQKETRSEASSAGHTIRGDTKAVSDDESRLATPSLLRSSPPASWRSQSSTQASGTSDYFTVTSSLWSEASKSREAVDPAPTIITPSPGSVAWATPPPSRNGNEASGAPSGDKDSGKAKTPDRKRSQSVSMLQRATSALASNTNKNNKGKTREADADELPDRSVSKRDGKSKDKDFRDLDEASKSGSNLPLSGLFSRKPSDGKPVSKGRETEPAPAAACEGRSSFSLPTSPVRGLYAAAEPGQRRGSDPVQGAADITPSGTRSGERRPTVSSSDTHESLSTVTGEEADASATGTSSSTDLRKRANGADSTTAARPKTNLFSTFRLWFNEDRRRRKRKMAPPNAQFSQTMASRSGSMRARQGSNTSVTGYRSADGSRTSIVRQPSTGSRRSSVHSSQRVSLDMPNGAGAPGKARRRSDSDRASFGSVNGSRTPTSEHGSISSTRVRRSLEGQSGSAGGGRRRTGHMRAGSTGSAGSRRSGSHMASTPPFRRTPSGTTVRRIVTNSASGASRRHSRSQSQASSIRTSLSDDDEDLASSMLVGESMAVSPNPYDIEETIEEEVEGEEIPEPPSDRKSDNAERERERAFRKLSGEVNRLEPDHILSVLAQAQGQVLAAGDTPRRHPGTTTLFAAHKSRNVFGPPADAIRQSTGRSPGPTGVTRPKLRDVFARQSEDGEWVDEDDDPLLRYGGGLGQNPVRNDAPPPVAWGGASAAVPGVNPTEKATGVLGAGRYAGVSQASASNGAGAANWRSTQRGAGSSFRGPAIVEEEEEEEEE